MAILRSVSPTCGAKISEAFFTSASLPKVLATFLANAVLPVPGGPYKQIRPSGNCFKL